MKGPEPLGRFFAFCVLRLKGGVQRKVVRHRWLTWPNVVTSAGLIGVIWYAYLFLSEASVWTVLLAHVAVFLSDVLDGWLADRLQQHSFVGAWLDPARDRLHGVAMLYSLIVLSDYDNTMLVLTVGAVICEVLIIGHGFRGKIPEPHMLGKIRAGMYGISTALALFLIGWLQVSIPVSFFGAPIVLASFIAMTLYLSHDPEYEQETQR